MRGHAPTRVGELWKTCTECEKLLPLDEFHRNASSPDGKHSKCKACKNLSAKERYRIHGKNAVSERKSYESSRERHLIVTYGINLQTYNKLLQEQNYCCAVCGKHAEDEKKSLHVDHDHVTREIRGLLCNHCNRQVIGKHRNPDVFKSAYEYLKKGTGLFVPKKTRTKKRKPNRNE